ncbi:MAG: Protein kinase [Deltaproteobacteria bacterium]|nr:Protein kinase [Deltaproteobacteria bacterium]
MGVVAKCTHLGLNELVALKMLRQDVVLDRDATERFMREARAASKLRSEHVARVVDVGTFPESDVPYMVMEFLDGHDLGDLLKQRGTIPAPWACALVLQAAEALAEAHSIDIVHRDIKPTNLFVTWRPDGSAILKVLDFGISKAPTGADMQLTQTQSLLGTPAYMSPEQMRSARLVDARTDIWSLGVVLYELLEGHRPFEADSFSEMCVKVAMDSPGPMTMSPPALQDVVRKCLAKSPDQRYANMAELGRDLIPFAQDPHGSAQLVERMQRVLGRRNHADWEQGVAGRTPLPGRAVTPSPAPSTDPFGRPFPSGPGTDPFGRPFQASGPGTDPFGRPFQASAPGSAPVSAQHEFSPSENTAIAFRRSKLPVFLLGFIVLGVAVGAVLMLRDRGEAEPVVRNASEPVKLAPEPAQVVPGPPPPVIDPRLATGKPGDLATTTPHPVVGPGSAQAIVKTVGDKEPTPKVVDSTKRPIRNPKITVKKDPNKTGKTVGKEVSKVPTPKVDDPPKPVDDCPAIDRIRPGAPCSRKSH